MHVRPQRLNNITDKRLGMDDYGSTHTSLESKQHVTRMTDYGSSHTSQNIRLNLKCMKE